MSAHPVFAEVLRIYGKPIAAPSANRFGRISPTSASHVLAELGDRIPLIIDVTPCLHGIESTIVRVHEHGVEILRHGPVTDERLPNLLSCWRPGQATLTPGSMQSHYAPETRLILSETWRRLADKRRSRFPRQDRLSALVVIWERTSFRRASEQNAGSSGSGRELVWRDAAP